MFVSVVIVAAGRGKRMGESINKVFLNLNGKPVLYHTINAFENLPAVQEIILVVSKGEIKYCKENIVDKFRFTKVKKIVEGGEERQQSVFNGLMSVNEKATIIAIHDGARPLITSEVILQAIEAAYIYKAVGVGVPVKDTIKVVNNQNVVINTPDRRTLWSIQTPQVFEKEIILNAHKKAIADGFAGTDDTVLIERMGIDVMLVEGDYKNIKITTPEDLIIAEAFLKK
ncbi:MAG: 2-C-methyl-D-erythritol 4-phosphate cytidylyltransferase [Thermoanaerobacteraceae bacterium]